MASLQGRQYALNTELLERQTVLFPATPTPWGNAGGGYIEPIFLI